LEYVKKALN